VDGRSLCERDALPLLGDLEYVVTEARDGVEFERLLSNRHWTTRPLSIQNSAVWERTRTADAVPDPVAVSFFEPRPDAKPVYTDANQVCWNKAELRRVKANYTDDQAVDN
jgi:hypothetical protein